MHLNEARLLALSMCRILEPERVPLDAAMGRVLAEAVHAGRDVPWEARSRLDGYAVRSGDLAAAGPETPCGLTVLPVMIAAGHAAACVVRPGECVRIMTGAPLPEGADAVLAQEAVTLASGHLVSLRSCLPGDGVVLPGTDVRKGDGVLDPGDVLTPTRMALLAALGLEEISAVRRPRVALLSTGDEVRDLGGPLGGAYTHCNTRYLLAWSVLQQGGQPIHLGTAGDEPDAVAAQLADTDADLVISTGGMGQGDRDFVLQDWERLGIRPLFTELNLSPGRRSALGIRGGQLFWGLPGNPWGAQVVFVELIVPQLWAMQGVGVREPFSLVARLTRPLRNKTRGFKAVRGILDDREAPARFSPATHRTDSLFAGLRSDLAYVLLEDHRAEVPAGESIRVRLYDFPLLASPLFGMVR
jgi:molybdopterin molybdotransferase